MTDILTIALIAQLPITTEGVSEDRLQRFYDLAIEDYRAKLLGASVEPSEYFVFAGLDWHRAEKSYFEQANTTKLALYTAESLAARVAQAQAEEREACAQVCDAASKREDDMGAILGRAIRALIGGKA